MRIGDNKKTRNGEQKEAKREMDALFSEGGREREGERERRRERGRRLLFKKVAYKLRPMERVYIREQGVIGIWREGERGSERERAR
jgi:hypothetical protein